MMDNFLQEREVFPNADGNYQPAGNEQSKFPLVEENNVTSNNTKAFPETSTNCDIDLKTAKPDQSSCDPIAENADETVEKESNKESKPKLRERKGSLRRNLSIGNLRRKFKKQHSRSHSESPSNPRTEDPSERTKKSRLVRSDTASDGVNSPPMSPGGDEVFEKAKTISNDQTAPLSLPPRRKLRHSQTLPRFFPSPRMDSQDSNDGMDAKLKAVQEWQKACICCSSTT